MDNSSKCPKCENSNFEVVNEMPVNSNFELIFVRCASCHTVVGTIDFYNVGALIKKAGAKVKSGSGQVIQFPEPILTFSCLQLVIEILTNEDVFQ